MNHSQQIIPGPRQVEMRPAGRPSSLEFADPGGRLAHYGGQYGGEEVRYFALLRRHRNAILAILLLSLLASGLYAMLGTKVYRAKTVLEVMGLNQDFMNTKDVDPNAAALTEVSYIETQTRLLLSDPVIDRTSQLLAPHVPAQIAAKTGLVGSIQGVFGKPSPASEQAREAVVRDMAEKAKVKAEGQTSLIALTVDGPDAQLAADTANTIANQYIEEGQDARLEASNHTGQFLTRQLEEARTKLQTSEAALQEYARGAGIILTNDNQDSVATEKLREIQQDLAKAQADQADRQSQLEAARTSPADSLPQVLDDPSLRDDKARLADLRRQLADLSTTLTPANYKVQRIQAQINDLEAEFERQRAAIIKRISVENGETARRKQLLSQAYNQQMTVVSDQSGKQVKYNILKREVDANREIYQSMLQRVKEANVVSALRASAVRVVSPATRPNLPYEPNLVEDLALGLLIGCVLSFLYIVVRERGDKSVRLPGESLRGMDVPELAVIPTANIGRRDRIPLALRHSHAASAPADKNGSNGASAAIDTEIVKWCQQETMMAEAYRSAVTSILLSRQNGSSPRVILVTSPRPRAGKTTAVSNLAISLAEIGRRVLVVDGDLRRPQLGRMFGLQFATGLSDLLSGGGAGVTLESVIRKTSVPGVYVLPGGSAPANISQLLHSARLDDVIESAREQFDYVLIDSPPMMGMADARLLSRNADGVILICRAGHTSLEQMATARQRLAEDGTTVIGTILNDCDLRVEDPTYYHSYASYVRVARD